MYKEKQNAIIKGKNLNGDGDLVMGVMYCVADSQWGHDTCKDYVREGWSGGLFEWTDLERSVPVPRVTYRNAQLCMGSVGTLSRGASYVSYIVSFVS